MSKRDFFNMISILSICGVIFLAGKLYFNGDNFEKEKILSATVWKLSDDGYKKDEIKSIEVKYDPIKGGALPYDVYVVFKKNPSEAKIYSWSSLDKESIEDTGSTAAP